MVHLVRVVHFSRGFDDYVISLANGLGELVDLTVVLAASDERVERYLSHRVRVYKSDAPRVGQLANIPAMLRLARQVGVHRPDILHFQNGVVWEGLVALLNAKIPVVTTIHDVTRHPSNTLLPRMTPQVILDVLPRRSSAIVVHGERLANDVRHRFDFGPRQPIIEVIPHPIIRHYGTGCARSSRGQNILFFGFLDRYKGVEILLRALPLVANEVGNVTLQVTGRTDMPEYYKALTVPGSRVEWDLRYQDDADVTRIFQWADVVVLPYIEASQSGVLHLAASFSVPVVATRVGSLTEAIRHEQNGLLADPGDVESLAREVSRMLTDTDLRARVIAQMSKERETTLAENSVARATARLYHQVLERQSKTGS